jgi:uncharacterized SAM-binding protein YcdF (DUF218 family)
VPQELLFLKPLFTALILPPTLFLLIALLGWYLMLRSRGSLGTVLAGLSLVALWFLSCNAVAILLDRNFLPQSIALDTVTATQSLRDQKVQAIVVLGGGVESVSREYGAPQPRANTVTRMHYGVVLAKASGLPLGFSGGQGWSASKESDTEAAAVQRWLSQLGLAPLRWSEGKAHDTRESAELMAPMLKKDGITRIALVTNAWHMARAKRAFEAAGLVVIAAPTGFTEPIYSPALEWLPSAEGLRHSHQVLREVLGLALGQ